MLNRKTMDMGGALAKNAALSLFFKKLWGNDRELPKVAKKSFNQVMRERLKINS
jgi:L-lactate dehydrogenase complex protein LldF